MKKIMLCSVSLFTLFAFSCLAKSPDDTSASVKYASDVIRMLGACNDAMSVKFGEDEQPASVAGKIAEQNEKLEKARSIISGYAGQEDFNRQVGGSVLIKIIDTQINNNKIDLDMYDKVKDKKTEDDFTEDEWNGMTEQADAKPDNKWGSVLTMGPFAIFDLVNMPKEGKATGKIKFKISSSDKKRLIKELDDYFSAGFDDIRRNGGSKEFDADSAGDFILLAAYRMRNILSSQTFEEARKMNDVWAGNINSNSK